MHTNCIPIGGNGIVSRTTVLTERSTNPVTEGNMTYRPGMVVMQICIAPEEIP